MKSIFNKALTLALIGVGLNSLPAQAVQISFSGSANIDNVFPVIGDDGIGDTWQTLDGLAGVNSSFAMADGAGTPQPFNSLHFSNGLGTFANSFQLTVNRSQNSLGFEGLNIEPVASGRSNSFVVMPDVSDPSTWVSWLVEYNLMADNGLFQQVLFTAPAGTQLAMDENFTANVNFTGRMTNDSGWAASFDDRASQALPTAIPEPGTMALAGLGLIGLLGVYRRRQK